tara:strand:+ start:561 stop:818 length:258 start_codon:yes stop_codon:yes gene_type:complete
MANILQQIGQTVKSKLDDKVDKTDAVTDFLKSILGFPEDTVSPDVDTAANITARTSDDAGTIMYGSDTYDLYVFDGSNWQVYNNS